ncbi:MAG: O-acetylhomoserine aminocarboxypropyltransferase/cysteine synthase family protein [Alphaproteobacteria bacterium]
MKEETIVLHAGHRRDETTTSVAVPIYQTTSYQFNNTEHASKLFSLQELGNIYTRIMNPTCAVLEERMAKLEGGVAAMALSSGQAASAYSIQNICHSGDNFVSSTDLYGGTWNLFSNTMKEMGIECRFVDPAKPEEFNNAIDDKTRCIYAETLPNPKLQVFPISEVGKIAKENKIPLIVDNTAAPYISKPLSYGANIVVYSTTKYIGGHGISIGGLIIDGGNFDWESAGDKFKMLNSPDPSYHGAIWSQAAKPLGPIAYILRARVILLRDLGASMSPFNAFTFIQGLETLPLRMQRHCENADKVAKFLDSHKKIEKVIYPGLMKGIYLERAKQYMKNGYGALIGFELKDGIDSGKKFIDNLKLFYHVANIGDARSLAIHPSSTTHSQLSKDEQASSGVTPGYVRLSIGIEHIDDILEDLEQALSNS